MAANCRISARPSRSRSRRRVVVAAFLAGAALAAPRTATGGESSECKDDSAQRDSEACVLLDKIQVDILRLAAQRLVERGDKTDPARAEDGQPLFERAGTAYVDTYRVYCQEPLRQQRAAHIDARVCEEMAYNGARAFAAAHRTSKAVVAYKMIVTEADRTRRSSPLAAKAMYSLGASYQSMALYPEAADWYERFATLHPREPESATALTDALLLRLGLGDEPAAMKDAAAWLKNWGQTRRPEAAQIEYAIAAHHAEHGANERARAILHGAMEMFDRGPLDLTILAHALAASVAESRDVARAEHAKVLAAWSDPEAAESALRRARPGDDQGQLDRRLGRIVNAVGAARFFVAEDRRRAEVGSVKAPVYTGAFEKGALTTYAQTTLRDWYAKKRAAIERVEPEYIKVLDIQPVPPPKWVIASGAAIGTMWSDLADDIRRAPSTDAWKKDPLYKAYFDALEAMAEPLRTRFAKPAMKKCLDLSIKYQWFDVSSKTCETWLVAHDGKELHPVEELIAGLRDPSDPPSAQALQPRDPPLRAPSPPPDR